MRISPITSVAAESTMLPIVLILGDVDRAEMRPLIDWLHERVLLAARSVIVREVANVMTGFAVGEFPDLIVVLQGWSDEYSTGDVNWLLAFAPLARVIVCYGAWCESDGRNHNIWPLSVRVPVWSAPSRIEREWQPIQSPGDQPPLPWSASREEVFAADHPPVPIWTEPRSILVDSPDSAYRQFLQEVMVAEGHTVDAAIPTVLLFDADPWEPLRAIALQAVRDRHPQADVFILMSLAPPIVLEEFQRLGITNVLHKFGFRRQCGAP